MIGQLSALVAVLLGWMLLSWIFHSPRLDLFPPPWEVGARLVQLTRTELPADIGASVAEAAGGWIVGSIVGIAVGALIGRLLLARLLLRSPIDFLRFISPLAWVPLMILWFGIGYWSKAAIIFLISFFTVVVNTAQGMASIDRDTGKVARSLRVLCDWGCWGQAVPSRLKPFP